ncbi:rhodanese-like domain-containing protein [Robiginitalea sp. SC105]|uniref:MBL fold metallo-hydrolase n=1 Tax=Robiginitalea sp. SC105 TaxID=2762332 RepID=UPI00163A09C7|nr:rhodanese-like domain-containing protein [Robiginitalea sp. SC105]MBC2839332.1 MBL fold metallo-hydrolase [Robiginitalea sp. SC105]
MKIRQFEDKPLAHYSYAILSEGKIALVDPSRDPMPYYRFAEEHNARITAVFETHPHADFVSSHLQIHKETGAVIYASKLVGASYPHKTFDEGDKLQLGEAEIWALNTPGHSPDSITVMARDSRDTYAMFSGDTLFIGDVGRPDLREKAGNLTAKREELARMMYRTVQDKFTDLPDKTLVYPAHGAGSLCGKNLSSDASSTLGNERMGNWAFRSQSEEDFVGEILKGQPFIPHYFGYDVDTNKEGPDDYEPSMAQVPLLLGPDSLEPGIPVVDTRSSDTFKAGHYPGSINIMARDESDKIETWLGSILLPEEPYYLVIGSVSERDAVLARVAKIGYEKTIRAVVVAADSPGAHSEKLDLQAFKDHPGAYTIVDIRNPSEVADGKYFEQALTIPLNELRDRTGELPTDKPFVVHCAGGYRSAAGSSILESVLPGQKAFDLSEAVAEFKPRAAVHQK